jgi:hypothetical protein
LSQHEEHAALAQRTEEILARELGKLAARSGKDDAGEIGESVVRWVARRLPNDAFTVPLQLAADADAVFRAAADLLDEEGELQAVAAPATAPPAVSGVVRSGFLGLNPAVVTIEVIPQGERQATVNVSGVAKEGLIKQHAGQKAAQRIADRLKEMFPAV